MAWTGPIWGATGQRPVASSELSRRRGPFWGDGCHVFPRPRAGWWRPGSEIFVTRRGGSARPVAANLAVRDQRERSEPPLGSVRALRPGLPGVSHAEVERVHDGGGRPQVVGGLRQHPTSRRTALRPAEGRVRRGCPRPVGRGGGACHEAGPAAHRSGGSCPAERQAAGRGAVSERPGPPRSPASEALARAVCPWP